MAMFPQGRARAGGRPKVWPAAVLGAVVLGAAAIYAFKTADYHAYDLGYTAEGERVSVQTWAVELPAGYELVWWQSTPDSPQDGLRFFPPR
ncbi:MAG: hypothetical protein K0R39_1655 [Symbiobacteriaceae bacterium]|nr:hypothetical protein [Symbiobacteriaceae bacterium]